jgi:ornithine decarboxylase
MKTTLRSHHNFQFGVPMSIAMADFRQHPADEQTRANSSPHRPLDVRLTPFLELDVDAAVTRYRRLAAALHRTTVHYAVKANPEPRLLRALAAAGCCFDVASPAEVTAALQAGAETGELVYSNPIKRRADIAFAAGLGVSLFVVDSLEETRKVAAVAPGAKVLCRIGTSGKGSDWSLSRKYGCSPAEAVHVLRAAAVHGLAPAGVSFHVGSQQRDPQAWDAPIAAAAHVFATVRAIGLTPWLVDLGGGFPAHLEGECPPLASYGTAIEASLRRHFPTHRPATLVEPGRAVVADAGMLVTTVIGVVRRGDVRWVYLDAGVFTGLVETLDEAIRYRLETSADGGPTGPCVLAGPTCDSADVLYEHTPVQLPLSLREGDVVRLLSAGAYTSCYSTVGFNGFDPLRTRLMS